VRYDHGPQQQATGHGLNARPDRLPIGDLVSAPFPIPGEVLESAGIERGQVNPLNDRIPNWRVTISGQAAVLKRDWHLDENDIAWEHQFLTRLAVTGFPAPRPITAFAGRSWIVVRRALWSLVSFLPGRTLGSEDRPDLGEVGKFIARYHDAVEDLVMDSPRPLVPTVDDLAELAPWDRLERTLHGVDGVRQFREYLDQTASELAAMGHASSPRLLIHGDFTTDNILIDGEPPRIVGAIDFALTTREVALADVAFSLWRSGRPEPQAMALDEHRVAAMVAGYASCRKLPGRTVRALPAYLKARGLQLIVRATRAGALDCWTQLERIRHIAGQQEQLEEALSTVL
jgi:Ser/Thr protein kinase RdoA (MazF antagonist)